MIVQNIIVIMFCWLLLQPCQNYANAKASSYGGYKKYSSYKKSPSPNDPIKTMEKTNKLLKKQNQLLQKDIEETNQDRFIEAKYGYIDRKNRNRGFDPYRDHDQYTYNKEDYYEQARIFKTDEDEAEQTNNSIAEIFTKRPFRNKKRLTKAEKKQQAELPPTKDDISNKERSMGFYKGIFGSLFAYGSGDFNASEKRNIAAGDTAFTTRTTVTSGVVVYSPFAEAGLKLGMRMPSFAGATVPASYRWDLEFAYTRMQTLTNPIYITDQSITNGSPGSNFILGQDFFNTNFYNISVNGYADLGRIGPGYPFLGVGAGIGIMQFDGNINTGFVLPTFNIYAGYIIDINKKFTISIAYKLNILYNNTYGLLEPLRDGNKVLDDTRPTQDNVINFGLMFLHKIEVSFLIF